MKIAHLLGSLNAGGTEILELDVFRNASKHNLDILCIHRKTGSLHEQFLNSGAKIFHLPLKSKFDIGFLFRLRKLIKSQNIDIIHCHQTLDARLTSLACFGLKTKVILTFHSNGLNASRKALKLQKFALKKLPALCFVSNYTKSVYLKRFNLQDSNRFHVTYNGIDVSKLLPAKTSEIRQELQIERNTMLIGSVGSFSSGRDHHTICRFLKMLKSNGIKIHFLFVGAKNTREQNYFEECVQYCKENDLENFVTFTGARDDIPQLLPQLDAFIYSSNHDTFGIAVAEAMGSGIPVFVNDWDVMQEITQKGRYATMWKSKDEHSLMNEFGHFLDNHLPYEKKAKEAARFVAQTYSIEKHIENLKRIYGILNNCK